MALASGEPVTLDSANTIADGTAVKRVGDRIFEYAKKNIDQMLTVEDDELVGAFLDMVENHKMIVENSGLLTVAALKQLDLKGKKAVAILSGGNMDVITMSSIVQHGLIQRDRIFSASVLLPDKPGQLALVAQTIADAQGNVIKLEHNQFVSTNRRAAVELRITMEAYGTEHKNQIMKALEEKDSGQERSVQNYIKNSIERKPERARFKKSFGFSLFAMGFLKDFCFVLGYNR